MSIKMLKHWNNKTKNTTKIKFGKTSLLEIINRHLKLDKGFN